MSDHAITLTEWLSSPGAQVATLLFAPELLIAGVVVTVACIGAAIGRDRR